MSVYNWEKRWHGGYSKVPVLLDVKTADELVIILQAELVEMRKHLEAAERRCDEWRHSARILDASTFHASWCDGGRDDNCECGVRAARLEFEKLAATERKEEKNGL